MCGTDNTELYYPWHVCIVALPGSECGLPVMVVATCMLFVYMLVLAYTCGLLISDLCVCVSRGMRGMGECECPLVLQRKTINTYGSTLCTWFAKPQIPTILQEVL